MLRVLRSDMGEAPTAPALRPQTDGTDQCTTGRPCRDTRGGLEPSEARGELDEPTAVATCSCSPREWWVGWDSMG